MTIEANGRDVLIRLPKMFGAARALLRLRSFSGGGKRLRLPRETNLPEVRVKAGLLPAFRVL